MYFHVSDGFCSGSGAISETDGTHATRQTLQHQIQGTCQTPLVGGDNTSTVLVEDRFRGQKSFSLLSSSTCTIILDDEYFIFPSFLIFFNFWICTIEIK